MSLFTLPFYFRVAIPDPFPFPEYVAAKSGLHAVTKINPRGLTRVG